MVEAGNAFLIGSPTLICIKTAPAMSIPRSVAPHRADSLYHIPKRRSPLAQIFRVHTAFRNVSESPYTANSSGMFLALPPLYGVSLLKRRVHTLSTVSAMPI